MTRRILNISTTSLIWYAMIAAWIADPKLSALDCWILVWALLVILAYMLCIGWRPILRLYRLATCRHEFRMPPEPKPEGPFTTTDEYFTITAHNHVTHRLCWRCGRFIATGKEGEK